MVHANRATDAGEFFQSIGRYNGEEEPEVSPLVKELNEIMLKYDTSALFRQFGWKKYKDERDFLLKVDDAYIHDFIRPYIEKLVAQVIDRLVHAGYPLFLKNNRLDNFYHQQRLSLRAVSLRAVLCFERTGEFTRYVLRLTDGERMFYPCDYNMKVLTRRPCRVVCGHQLFSFADDFDGQRLQPFLTKREIMIPKANEQMYFRKFILKSIRQEEIEVQGFTVVVRQVDKRALLSLESGVFARPMLSLGFYYGTRYLPAWSERKALVELHTEGDDYAFYKVYRDAEWEEQQGQTIRALGLAEITPGCFRLAEIEEPEEEQQDEERSRKEWEQLVDWICRHCAELKECGIGISQQSLRQPYYLGEWRMELALEETEDWFNLKAVVILGNGRKIPLLNFREHIISGRRDYLLEDGTIFLIPYEWFAAYSDMLLFAGGKGATLVLHKSQHMLLEKTELAQEIRLPAGQELVVSLPQHLRATLRPYQQLGYEWLYRLYHNGLGSCLADDMGLGKTLQIITLILKYRQETVKRTQIRRIPEGGAVQLTLFETGETVAESKMGEEYHTCLIIVPASLVHNWRSELRKFAPTLTVTLYVGPNRHELRPFLQQSDVVVTTYHTLRNDIGYISRLTFGIVVADEAQTFKNPASMLHQAMSQVQGKWFYALSGTPIENSLTDLWAILDLVNRGMLGTHHFFRNHFIKPILADVEGRMSEVLKKLIAPYILRRTKEEVLADLPDLTTELVLCEPDDEQRKVYEEEQARVRNYLLEKQDRQEGFRNDFMVLKALIRLRQMANHPRLVDADYAGGSGKFREVFRMLQEVVGAGHKVLVFSSFVKYLSMVDEKVAELGWQRAMLTGATLDREAEIRRFCDDPQCRLFLISLKAGGVGLNLTEADYVFILDPWWNLAAENQAVGRAHRIGQKHAVFVYRFITAGTLEEKILAIQQRKQRLADSVITTSALVPLSDEELIEVLNE